MYVTFSLRTSYFLQTEQLLDVNIGQVAIFLQDWYFNPRTSTSQVNKSRKTIVMQEVPDYTLTGRLCLGGWLKVYSYAMGLCGALFYISPEIQVMKHRNNVGCRKCGISYFAIILSLVFRPVGHIFPHPRWRSSDAKRIFNGPKTSKIPKRIAS